jgi:hypothetical protein
MSEPVAKSVVDDELLDVPSFDLKSLSGLTPAQELGTEVHITHPGSGEPLGITMIVAGPDSKRQKAATSLIISERAELRLRKITAARMEDEGIRITAASIISWSGVVEDGKEIEYSPSAALGLLTRFPFIREQITAYSSDRANFLKKS